MSTHLDREDITGFEERGGSRTGADLERESGGAEEGELYGLEDGQNLLLLSGEEVFPGDRPRGRGGGSVAAKVFLREDDGGDSALGSVPGGDSAAL